MVQIQINTMRAIIQLLTCSLLSNLLSGKPLVFSVPSRQDEARVTGNLKLFYKDGTTFSVNYDSFDLKCNMTSLPYKNKIITKVEATTVDFMLYYGTNWRSWQKHVEWGTYSASDLRFPRPMVRSIRQPGCTRR